MKKALLTTLGVAALGMASYAATFMRVKTADGKIVRYSVEDVIEVDFEDEFIPSDTTPASAHSYVDLGLPSGTLWATYNIGATKPEEFGDYFAWGETEPKEVYDWSTYKYAKARWNESDKYWGLDSLTKYNSGNSGYPGLIDSLTTLLPEDDAATANWGSDWRMPTYEELQELVDNCKYEWTKVNGVIGSKFTASNGNSIFLPATGGYNGLYVDVAGEYGYYWLSLRSEKYMFSAHLWVFFDGGEYEISSRRYLGHVVRAVRAKK